MNDPCNVYRGRYKEFIECILRKRNSKEKLKDSQNHHIIPKCTFNSKDDPYRNSVDNSIYLTHREHFIAHKILAEDNPENRKLTYSYMRMCNSKYHIATPEEYETARILLSESLKGSKLPAETRRKISDSKKNLSEITRKRMIGAQKVANQNPEVRKHKAEGQLGKKHTEEHKLHIGESCKGEKNGFYGKNHTEDSRRKMSDAWRNREVSENTKRKMSESSKGHIWINNGKENKSILPTQLEEYLASGFIRGMIRRKYE